MTNENKTSLRRRNHRNGTNDNLPTNKKKEDANHVPNKKKQVHVKKYNHNESYHQNNQFLTLPYKYWYILTFIVLCNVVLYTYLSLLKNGHTAEKYDVSLVDDDLNKWDTNNESLRKTHDFLSKYVCKDDTTEIFKLKGSSPYCHPLMKPSPTRRTHYVAYTKENVTVSKGDTIMILPRHLLIWDLDALRDDFIYNELLSVRLEHTGNYMDSGSFLAAYLIRRHHLSKKLWKRAANDTKIYHTSESMRLETFIDILPKYETLKESHPIFWSEDDLASLLGKYTPTYDTILAYQSMISSEYHSFCKGSSLFCENVSLVDYQVMRINVISRAFGPGPPGPEEEQRGIHGLSKLEDEIKYYQEVAGIDLNIGCRAMSPILDMWDHHANPNIIWRYIPNKRAFVISVDEDYIASGNDLMVSYGKYTDSHLFAKFGFVNGDGSGSTEANIASMHHIYNIGKQFSYLPTNIFPNDMHPSVKNKVDGQRHDLLNYLVFDDGYHECIRKTDTNNEGFKLKILKYRYLLKIANNHKFWTVIFGPRNQSSKPAQNSFTPIKINIDSLKYNSNNTSFDGSKIISTCRLLALTHFDFDGKAIEILTKVLDEDRADTFLIPRQTDELEFRALSYLGRLATLSLKKYPSSDVAEEMNKLFSLMNNDSGTFFRSREWFATHVKIGEMQNLELLRSMATSGSRQMMERVGYSSTRNKNSHLFIRHQPCPLSFTTEIINVVNDG